MKLNKFFGALACTLLVTTGALSAQAGEELFPPNAKPGECYARTFVPPVYETVTEKTVKHEAIERLEVIPATYETVEETVVVEEASERWEVVPATYDWKEETVMVKAASTRLVTEAPVYETVTEKILETPAHTVWKKGRGPVEKVDNHTGEIMCLIEEPATYKTVSKKVLKSPATTREVEIPAEYKTVRTRIMSAPPRVEKVEMPAKYESVRVTKVRTPAETRKIAVPAEYQTISRNQIKTEGYMAWRQVLCETNTTPDIVRKIQRALSAAGYAPGDIDGVLGSDTMTAVASFQSAKGLAKGGLTLETVKALGL